VIPPGSSENRGEKTRPHRISLATAALLLVLSASACAGASSQSGSSQQSSQRIQSEHLSTLSAKDFDPTNFDNSTTVDNKWFPLVPGAYSVFEGCSKQHRLVPHPEGRGCW
jgi:hypothetical protein